jgi:hypothetical protein
LYPTPQEMHVPGATQSALLFGVPLTPAEELVTCSAAAPASSGPHSPQWTGSSALPAHSFARLPQGPNNPARPHTLPSSPHVAATGGFRSRRATLAATPSAASSFLLQSWAAPVAPRELPFRRRSSLASAAFAHVTERQRRSSDGGATASLGAYGNAAYAASQRAPRAGGWPAGPQFNAAAP